MNIDFAWSELTPKLHPSIMTAITSLFNFSSCLPVQKATIPLFSKNYDVAV